MQTNQVVFSYINLYSHTIQWIVLQSITEHTFNLLNDDSIAEEIGNWNQQMYSNDDTHETRLVNNNR